MGYCFGHFEKVVSLKWLHKSTKRAKGFIGDASWNNSGDTFITCSHDMSIFIWKHFGDRWTYSFIDVVKCFDSSLNYQRKQVDNSIKDLKL